MRPTTPRAMMIGAVALIVALGMLSAFAIIPHLASTPALLQALRLFAPAPPSTSPQGQDIPTGPVAIMTSVLVPTDPPAEPNADYVVGVSDVLEITVLGNKNLDHVVTVRTDGKVSFPLVGEVKAAGLTVPQLIDVLTERLSASVSNLKVVVRLKDTKNHRVHVVGCVAKPGVHPLRSGMPLLEALERARGVSPGSEARAGAPRCQADLAAAYLIRGNEKIPVDLGKLVQEGNLSANIPLKTGDVIVVPETATASDAGDAQIYLLGRFAKPGVYAIKDEQLPVLHALFLAGGLAPGADAKKAFLIRGSTRTPVDLDRLLHEGDLTQNLILRAGDTLTIPESPGTVPG